MASFAPRRLKIFEQLKVKYAQKSANISKDPISVTIKQSNSTI